MKELANVSVSIENNAIVLRPIDRWPQALPLKRDTLTEWLAMLTMAEKNAKAIPYAFQYAAVTDRGLRRGNNQDHFLLLPSSCFFAVADGVGGNNGGETASRVAVDTLTAAFAAAALPKNPQTAEKALTIVINSIHENIKAMAEQNVELSGMATTLTALQFLPATAVIAHVGDSRAYKISNGKIVQLTTDHKPNLSQNNAATQPKVNSHIITRALGMLTPLEIDFFTASVQVGDFFLLATDGVTDLIPDAELAKLAELTDLQRLMDEIKIICYQRGARDNFTAIAIKIVDKPWAKAATPKKSTDEEDTVMRL